MKRSVEEIEADIQALADAGTKSGAPVNALRKERTAAVEALVASQGARITELEEGVQNSPEPPGGGAASDAERSAWALAIVAAHIARHGPNARSLQNLVTQADSMFDAYMGLKAGGDYETQRTKVELLSRKNAKLLRENATQREQISHLEELVKEYMSRLQMANLPV